MDIAVHPRQCHHGRRDLRPDRDRRVDHLVEPRAHQSRLWLHLLLRRLCRLAGRHLCGAQYIDPTLHRSSLPRTGIIAGAIGGIIVCLLVFIPLHDKPAFTSRGMIATLAISLIGSQLFLMVFGPTAKSLPELFGRWRVKFFDITLTPTRSASSSARS